MSKTSTAAKNRYNDKAYDRINLTIPKGQKDIIKAHADTTGESVNALIYRAVMTMIENERNEK